MHERTTELLRHLDDGRRALRAALDAIPPDERDERPRAGAWSAANILSHLARTEGQVAAFLQRLLRRALADAPLPPARAAGPVLESFDAGRVLDRTQKVEAPDFAAPDDTMPAGEAWAALERARSSLRQVLLAGDGLDTTTLRQAHFLFGELTFEQWIAFVGLHEQRHTAQMRALSARR